MSSARRGRRVALPAAAVLALGSFAVTSAEASPGTAPAPGTTAAATPRTATPRTGAPDAFYDARQPASTQGRAELDNRVARVAAGPAVTALRSSLGRQSIVDLDPTTLTPRTVARLDGTLTGPSSARATEVALGYVRAHRDVFGLSDADLAGLTLTREYVDVEGGSHLSWVQGKDGVPLFGNGLKANVAKDGRLVNVQGSPVPGLRAPAAGSRLSSAEVITRAKQDLKAARTAPAEGDTATPVLFATAGGTRSAYQVVTMSVARPALTVVDAETGRVLFRQSLTSDAAADEKALVFDNYPGAAVGGKQRGSNLTAKGWLPAGSVVLYGNNVHTYTDVNDDNASDPSEEITPNAEGSYQFPLQRVQAGANQPCAQFTCTWQPSKPYSWQLNRSQTSTNNFFLINEFHDHLAAAPIGFTEAAGNFQQTNTTGRGKGGDAVQDEPLDGANTAAGLPDGQHIDNANFATPPDGTAPRMQMFLWHQPGAAYPAEDPFLSVSGADDADIVEHEYTHGLSHRLVVDAGNVPALDSQQGGSMGEAWSDWYALDHLVDEGRFTDTAEPGEIQVGKYVLPGEDFRSEATDCTVGAPASACPGTAAAGSGGYTYGDFGKISSRGVEVHADGEIWSQTLWDLRTALGAARSESIVTRAMELSPTYPSFLDMRNAVLQADQAVFGGADTKQIWRTFAARGMGFFAGTVTGNDIAPVEDFSMPPAAGTPTGTVTGQVRDQLSGSGVAGAVVAFGGHDSGFPGSYAAVSDEQGNYRIPGVVPGTYPDVYSGGAGYNSVRRTLSVSSGTTTTGFSLVRDWAASSGGAYVAASNGNDSADYGCGPAALIDQALTAGWSTAKPQSGGRFATIALPAAVDVAELQIDPSGTCGDDLNASAGRYTVETSRNGSTFVPAAAGTFGVDDTGHLVTVPLKAGTGTAVRAIRYTILDNQAAARGVSCPGGAEGCPWLDSRELQVLGTAAKG